ncbi:MAG: hypothetical protein ACYDEQ_14460 [Desulfocucumaceae bacterium]
MSVIFILKMMNDRRNKKAREDISHLCPDDFKKRSKYSIRLKRFISSVLPKNNKEKDCGKEGE